MTEALCLLYVAITRAKQALYIIVQPSKKKDFQVKTAASLIYHALGCDADPTADNESLYCSGNPDWYKNDKGPAKPIVAESEPVKHVEIRFAHASSSSRQSANRQPSLRQH